MKNIDINSPVAQKIASAIFTKAIRDKYNLHASANAKGIDEEARKYGITGKELFEFMDGILPGLMQEYLSDMKRIMESPRRT